jgi:hypothetical protein
MPKSSIPLETLSVASPCTASWAAMAGDERARFCGQCRRHVYNLSELSRSEAEALIERTEGRLCVRFYQRADGTVMTSDCPVGLQAVRRLALAVGAGVAMLLMAFGGALALFGAHARDGTSGSRRWRDVEPIHTIVEWISPSPPRPVVMGALCPIERPVDPPKDSPDQD